jgi:VanZ family protein
LSISALDEWYHSYLPGRQAERFDLIADIVDNIIGTALLAMERIKRN